MISMVANSRRMRGWVDTFSLRNCLTLWWRRKNFDLWRPVPGRLTTYYLYSWNPPRNNTPMSLRLPVYLCLYSAVFEKIGHFTRSSPFGFMKIIRQRILHLLVCLSLIKVKIHFCAGCYRQVAGKDNGLLLMGNNTFFSYCICLIYWFFIIWNIICKFSANNEEGS